MVFIKLLGENNIKLLSIFIILNLIFLIGCLDKNPSKEVKITGEVIKDAEKQTDESAVAAKKTDKIIPPIDQPSEGQAVGKINKTSEIKQEYKYYDLKKIRR